MTIGLHRIWIMTTGLQRVPTTRRLPPFGALLRLLAAPWRTTHPPGRHHHHATTALAGTRPAHEIRRGARASMQTRARDVHDDAMLRGVFPPRV
jgi:hypothetical protein